MWNEIHAERSRLAEVLDRLDSEQWASVSLCSNWTVEQVVAHLNAVANTGTLAWFRSIVRARFNANRHNERLLKRYLGGNYGTTLEEYLRSIPLTIAPTKDYAAYLGEVIVHGQDIAEPLSIEITPEPESVAAVARFFATKDFAVNSRTLVRGLQLEADDHAFMSGDGPLVRGKLLDLVMALAGRRNYVEKLHGDGVIELRRRVDDLIGKR